MTRLCIGAGDLLPRAATAGQGGSPGLPVTRSAATREPRGTHGTLPPPPAENPAAPFRSLPEEALPDPTALHGCRDSLHPHGTRTASGAASRPSCPVTGLQSVRSVHKRKHAACTSTRPLPPLKPSLGCEHRVGGTLPTAHVVHRASRSSERFRLP